MHPVLSSPLPLFLPCVPAAGAAGRFWYAVAFWNTRSRTVGARGREKI